MFIHLCHPVKLITSDSWPPCITFQLQCHSNYHEWPCMKSSETTTEQHAVHWTKYIATHPLRYLWMKQPEDGPEESIWSTFSFWLLTESWRINPATFFRKEGIIYNEVNYQYNIFIAWTPITRPVTHSINNKFKKIRWQQCTALPLLSAPTTRYWSQMGNSVITDTYSAPSGLVVLM